MLSPIPPLYWTFSNVFEEGGDFSVDRFTLPYYPFLSYAGIKVPLAKESDRLSSVAAGLAANGVKHEMGADTTYFFTPESDPYNPNLTPNQRASVATYWS